VRSHRIIRQLERVGEILYGLARSTQQQDQLPARGSEESLIPCWDAHTVFPSLLSKKIPETCSFVK
jgi:hypothetical protein